jgi:hypothetical protein
MSPAERAASRISGAVSPRRAEVSAPGSSARSVGFRSPESRMLKRSSLFIDARRRRPLPSTSRPRSTLRCSRRTWPLSWPMGLEEMPLQSPPAQRSLSTRRIAANVERCSVSGPAGRTTESSTSDSTWSG